MEILNYIVYKQASFWSFLCRQILWRMRNKGKTATSVIFPHFSFLLCERYFRNRPSPQYPNSRAISRKYLPNKYWIRRLPGGEKKTASSLHNNPSSSAHYWGQYKQERWVMVKEGMYWGWVEWLLRGDGWRLQLWGCSDAAQQWVMRKREAEVRGIPLVSESWL